MYKIIICDDEQWICRSIQNMISNHQAVQSSITMCYDGKEAWELIEEEAPDIVITDIRMPYLDGLALVKLIRESKKNTQIIIISGYDDFTYAQKALKYDVIGYILKPINKQEFLTVLDSTCHAVDEEKSRQSLSAHKEDVLQKIALELLAGNSRHLSDLNQLMDISYDVKYYMAGDILFDPSYIRFSKINSLCQSIAKRYRLGSFILCETHPSHAVFLFIGHTLPAQNSLQKIFLELSASSPKHIIISCGFSVEAPDRLPLSADSSRRLINSRNVNAAGLIISSPSPSNWKFDRSYHYNQILSAFHVHDSEKLKLSLEEIFGLFFKVPYAPHDQLLSFCTSVCSGILEMLYHSDHRPADLISTGEKFLTDCGNYLSGHQCLSELQHFCEDAMKHLKYSASQTEVGDLIQQITSYLILNYAAPITLSAVAAQYHVNASYLSSLFKQKTGTNFMEYLTAIRLNAATQYLLNTNKSISVIAELTGYDNIQYFGRQFKKKYYLTPTEYREKHKEYPQNHEN